MNAQESRHRLLYQHPYAPPTPGIPILGERKRSDKRWGRKERKGRLWGRGGKESGRPAEGWLSSSGREEETGRVQRRLKEAQATEPGTELQREGRTNSTLGWFFPIPLVAEFYTTQYPLLSQKTEQEHNVLCMVPHTPGTPFSSFPLSPVLFHSQVISLSIAHEAVNYRNEIRARGHGIFNLRLTL